MLQNAITLVREFVAPEIEQLEARSPGHPFGFAKRAHMESLEGLVPGLIKELGLSEAEGEVLRLIVATHDVGRHREALLNLDTLRPGARHGTLSVDILRESGALLLLSETEQQVVIDAICYHAERELPDSLSGLGRKFCLVLRDLDRAELIRGEKMVSKAGIQRQLQLHYGVSGAYQNDPKASAVLSASPSTKLLEQFAAGETIAVQEIRSSYADYMLLHLAMAHDITNKSLIGELIVSQGFRRRVKFISERLLDKQQEQLFAKGLRLIRQRIEGE